MQSRAAASSRLLALSSLIGVVACTNAPQSAANNAGLTASTEVATSNMNSVNAVSDALGRRLDGMLIARQASH